MDELTDFSSAAPLDVEQLQQELTQAIAQAEENLSGWKRTQADFENYRRRKEAESSEWVTFGKQAGFVQILPVLDSLEQAFMHAPQIDNPKYQNWKSGLEGIVKQIDEVVAKMNIKKIDALGKKFDPNFHEAIREVWGEQDDIVAEVYQTGYELDGKVLRPAQVAITKQAVNGQQSASG